jgi:hypothetical protein
VEPQKTQVEECAPLIPEGWKPHEGRPFGDFQSSKEQTKANPWMAHHGPRPTGARASVCVQPQTGKCVKIAATLHVKLTWDRRICRRDHNEARGDLSH